jgi:hypothetical protein
MNHIRTLGAAALAAGLVATAAPAPAAGQSLFATRGLGVPAPAVDARAAALGGIGVGLIGFHTSAHQPGGDRRHHAARRVRGAAAGLHHDEVDGEEARHVGHAVPAAAPAVSRSASARSSARATAPTWSSPGPSRRRPSSASRTAPSRRRTCSAPRRHGAAPRRRRLHADAEPSPSALRAACSPATSSASRPPFTIADTLGASAGFEERTRWNYLAPMASVGVRWDIAGRLRIGASAMVGGEVEASVAEDGTLPERTLRRAAGARRGRQCRLSPLQRPMPAPRGAAPEGGETVSPARPCASAAASSTRACAPACGPIPSASARAGPSCPTTCGRDGAHGMGGRRRVSASGSATRRTPPPSPTSASSAAAAAASRRPRPGGVSRTALALHLLALALRQLIVCRRAG